MFTGMNDVVPRVAETAVLVAIGFNIRKSGLLNAGDGKVADKVATYLTLPSLILQATCTQGPLSPSSWVGLGVAAVCYITQAANNWLLCMGKQKRERAVLMGAGTGVALALVSYPVVECALGLKGVQHLALLEVMNSLAVFGASYLLTASAGPAFPQAYPHEDGGSYRGQWRGMKKEGVGVYTYASGARYEGEWRDNIKEGRGAYYFPKGGMYEGEWSGGVQSGVGVRTLASGEVRAGRWAGGRLESGLELWQCANAVEGAGEAALAARRVEVGGGTPRDVATALAHHPPLWAALVGLALCLTATPLPPALAALTSVLAPAHRPLALLAVGMTLPPSAALPRLPASAPHRVSDVVRLVGGRALVVVAVVGAVAATSPGADPAAVGVLAATLLALLAPIPMEAVQFTRLFRLDESLSTALVAASNLVAAPLLTLASLAVGVCMTGVTGNTATDGLGGAGGLAAAGAVAAVDSVGAAAGQALGWAESVGAGVGVMPLTVFCVVAAVALGVGMGVVQHKCGGAEQQWVRMVYSGAGTGAGGGAGTGAGAQPPRPRNAQPEDSSGGGGQGGGKGEGGSPPANRPSTTKAWQGWSQGQGWGVRSAASSSTRWGWCPLGRRGVVGRVAAPSLLVGGGGGRHWVGRKMGVAGAGALRPV